MGQTFVFLGDFTGNFYTRQKLVLGNADVRPSDDLHAVRVYGGVLKNALVQHEFDSDKHTNLDSFLLHKVPRVEVRPADETAFKGIRVYTFTKLLLINPRVQNIYLHNDKTYGQITSRAYGVTEDHPVYQIADPHGWSGDDSSEEGVRRPDTGQAEDSQRQPDVPLQVGEGYTGPGMESGGGVPEPPRPGMGEILSGCLSNIWRILGMLLVVWLMIVLVRSCGDSNICILEKKARMEYYAEKERVDKIRLAYHENLKSALSGISTIYFYQNSAEFHLNSIGNNSPILRLYNLMDAYADIEFTIEGYHTGPSTENAGRIDSIRAATLKEELVRMGMDPARLLVVPKGDSKTIDPPGKLNPFYVTINDLKYYNRNMRAEVKPKTEDEPGN